MEGCLKSIEGCADPTQNKFRHPTQNKFRHTTQNKFIHWIHVNSGKYTPSVIYSETKRCKNPIGALQYSKTDFRSHVSISKIDFRPQESWSFGMCSALTRRGRISFLVEEYKLVNLIQCYGKNVALITKSCWADKYRSR